MLQKLAELFLANTVRIIYKMYTLCISAHFLVFSISDVYQYFTIYRLYFFLKFEKISWLSYATVIQIRRYQLPF